MSDSEFELSSSSDPEDSGSQYVASEQENDASEVQQRRRPAARGPTRGAGAPASAPAAAARPRPAVAAPPPKRQRAGQQPKLTDLLQSASKEQLVTLLLELDGESGGGLADKVAALLPPPDLRGIQAEIQGLQRKVDKAFPHAKWGSNRGAYAYRRVGPALRDLKAALLEHAKTFAACKRHDTLLQYALYALGVAEDMPTWDADTHNKPRLQTIKQLEGLLVKALKAGAARTAEARSAARRDLDQLGLELPAARAALGAAV
ncbi:hypothetical protein ABPG75_010408 [Micractinium tetrahymenae]